MKERILEFLRRENKTSAQFAEEIGVQPSGISHILSGRNNPSLDFIIKMLEKYTFISTDWLLFGKGKMYRDAVVPDLFTSVEPLITEKSIDVNPPEEVEKGIINHGEQDISPKNITLSEKPDSQALKIVWFYSDSTFKEYYPRKD